MEKPLSNFHKNGNRHRGSCAACELSRLSFRRSNDPEFQRANRAAYVRAVCRQTGVTVDQYERDRKRQKDGCAICGADDAGLVLDHDHSTGRYRGPLCHRCNKMLGFSGDRVRTLVKAVWYLLRARWLHTGKLVRPAVGNQLALDG